eukprot:CAMPEP_0196722102 /NCGR_PEP_ID=MMETSP1091-20130531/4529_1 /TAXON_ID=302021 /ORGANISM="Rhodomonas sp., Strain CCMP768" /LENGTH=149 /DNA_ID=CAMNT_0042063721 /DNA_START=28 /DNA_END=477 /DNA_ORIENTATION=+
MPPLSILSEFPLKTCLQSLRFPSLFGRLHYGLTNQSTSSVTGGALYPPLASLISCARREKCDPNVQRRRDASVMISTLKMASIAYCVMFTWCVSSIMAELSVPVRASSVSTIAFSPSRRISLTVETTVSASSPATNTLLTPYPVAISRI